MSASIPSDTGSRFGGRMVANQDFGSEGRYFNQNDHFVHVGEKATGDPSGDREKGVLAR